MGLITTYVAYKIGKRRGERGAPPPVCVEDSRDETCSNYDSFCREFGSCDGMECDYE